MKTIRRHRHAYAPLAVLLAGALALPGCWGDGPEEDRSREITALHPWVRLPVGPMMMDTAAVPEATGAEAGEGEAGEPTGAEAGEAGRPAPAPVNTAAYLVIQNPTDREDALVGAGTLAAETVEIHSVTMDDGVMRMRQVDRVPIPAAGEAVLEPGGYHIMLIGLLDPLTEGDTVALSLELRSGRVMTVLAPVREGPPRP